MHKLRNRWVLLAVWVTIAAATLYFYFFRPAAMEGEIQTVLSTSVVLASIIYVLIGSARAFTLVPSTYLIIAALPFFPPTLLFVLTVIGVLISSALIYLFSEALQLEEIFERGKHKKRFDKLRAVLEKHELPIIVAWSFFPLAPTDLICYVCGMLKVNFPKFLFGILLGEGAICALYIFAGDSALRFLELKR